MWPLLKRLSRRLRPAPCRRLILSAGMPRSGSTWLYNAARLLLQSEFGDDSLSCGWIHDRQTRPVKKITLLKIHEFDDAIARRADVVLYSYRDIRDALASNERIFGTQPSLDLARRWIDDDRRWRAAAHFSLRYESMRAEPLRTLHSLAMQLDIEHADKAAILDILAQLGNRKTPPEDSYDSETLMHNGHLTDGRHGSWRGQLCPQLVRRIEEDFALWLDANGYQ